MHSRLGRLRLAGSVAALGLGAKAAWAQSSGDNAVGLAAMGFFMMFALAIGLGFYVYTALALQTIANKTQTENSWLAWIPIANFILMLNIAKKPLWWIVLLLIPVANLVILVMVWMGIAQAVRKPDWWGIMIIVPVMNFVVPAYLAWG